MVKRLGLAIIALISHSFISPAFAGEFPTLEAMGLNPRVIEYRSLHAADDLPLLDLELGRMTRAQFNELKAYFRNTSLVQYSSRRVYKLTDFLTPQMQALYGMDYVSPRLNIPHFGSIFFEVGPNAEVDGGIDLDSSLEIRSTANCWGTAWNNILSLQSPQHFRRFEIGHVHESITRHVLLGDTYGRALNPDEPLRFGDLIPHFVYTPSTNEDGQRVVGPAGDTLVHVPMYLIDGLVFEKEDSSRGNPFRIVRLRDTTQSLVDGLKPHLELIVRHRRLLDEGKPYLPTMLQVASFGNETSRRILGEEISARLLSSPGNNSFGATIPYAEFMNPVYFTVDGRTGLGAISTYENSRTYFSLAYDGISMNAGSGLLGCLVNFANARRSTWLPPQ